MSSGPLWLLIAASLAAHSHACAAAGAADEFAPATAEWRTIPAGEAARQAPVAPVRVMFEANAGTGAVAAPEGFHAPHFASVAIGGHHVTLVLGRSAADAEVEDRAWFDLDGDGRPATEEVRAIAVERRALNDGRVVYSGGIEGLALAMGGRELPFAFSSSRMGDDPPRLALLALWYLEARVTLDGRELAILFRDGDADGRFDGPEDRWGALPAERVGEEQLRATNMLAAGEGLFLDGCRIAPSLAADLTVAVAHRPATAPDAADLEKVRVRTEHEWAARFDKEREQFAADRGLDVSRPRAERAIEWRYVTFDQAQAMAQAEGKPLFVDVMAFWCVWCYRMDYYTYPDREVAELLGERFVPVKIIQEQDLAGDYQRIMQELGARGIPAMGVWSPAGDLVKTIGGWKKPEEFVADLEEALEKAGG